MRTVARAIAGLVVLLVAGSVVLVLPPFLTSAHGPVTEAERLKAENDVRGAILQLFAGALLVGGLYYTARTYEVTRQGSITDRYSNAVNQLGHDKLDVRLGGIYALARIANDSHSDCGTIIDVLAAFVRGHSRTNTTGIRPDSDVEAALTVIGRLPKRSSERQRIDLSGASLAGLRLVDGDLGGANLHDADLSRAVLDGIRLNGANLAWTRMRETKLERANLKGATLVRADLSGALLCAASLTKATLDGANLTGAHLSGRDGRPARVSGASFLGAVLSQTVLLGVDMSGVVGVTRQQFESALTDPHTIIPAQLTE